MRHNFLTMAQHSCTYSMAHCMAALLGLILPKDRLRHLKRSIIPRGKSKVQACCCNHGNRSRSVRPGTSSEAGQIGRSTTLLHTALHRQGAGQRMLTLPPRPSLLAVTPATITLTMACREERGSSGGTKYI